VIEPRLLAVGPSDTQTMSRYGGFEQPLTFVVCQHPHGMS
jgi:hypothetical protein